VASGSVKCPRCGAAVSAVPDEVGRLRCSGCGAKLRSRAPVVVKVQAAVPAPEDIGDSMDIDSVLARLDARDDPSATLPLGTPLKKIPRPEERPRPAAPARGAVASGRAEAAAPDLLDHLVSELRAVRRVQDDILRLLRRRLPARPAIVADELPGGAAPEPDAPVVRSRRRKTVLLIDDDEEARAAAIDALAQAEVPVATASDGNEGLAAIALEKPDVIVLELGLRGAMAGKDVVHMIKATMEWADIPIVLYTRQPVADPKEARRIRGADELVPKAAGPAALVSKVIEVFRRG